MRYVKWGFWLFVAALVGAVLHYTLPQRDIVRIVETEVERQDFGVNSLFWASADSGSAAAPVSRDVRFIRTVQDNGDVMVYRNEDTGWIWPPYFKFDSSDLQAEAANLISTKDTPQWLIVRHYGWRSNWLTIFPNAISVRPIEDPEIQLIPWFNIIFLVILLALIRAVQVRVRRWWGRIAG